MAVTATDLPAIEAALHTGASSVPLADGTSLKVKVVRPKANAGRGCRSVAALTTCGANIQFNEHDRSKSSKWSAIADAGSRVTWVLVGKFPHRAAVPLIDGKLSKAIPQLPGAPVTGDADDAEDEEPDDELPGVGASTAGGSSSSTAAAGGAAAGSAAAGGASSSAAKAGAKKTKAAAKAAAAATAGSAAGPPAKKAKLSKGPAASAGEAMAEAAEASKAEAVKAEVAEAVKAEAAESAKAEGKSSTASSSSILPPEPSVLATCSATLRSLDRDSEEFWKLEELVAAHTHGRNEDYNASRLQKGEKPVSFVLAAAEAVNNPVLAEAFDRRRRFIAESRGAKEGRERHAFHGTHPSRLKTLCDRGLLPFGHALNPVTSPVDSGYFGSCRKGVYVSRYADYTLKYANRLVPLRPGERCRVVLFRCVPGLSRHIEKLCGPIDPTPGYDSHSSPQFLEWFLFSPDQCCPTHVLTVEAREDTRTAADDQ